MSLWHCPEHGLYGGSIGCPLCGRSGEFVEIEPEAAPERHAWDDLKEELRWGELHGLGS